MLVLTRYPQESVLIGSDIVVTILGVEGERVRLGISAPRQVRVDREEVRRAIDEDRSRRRYEPED